MIDTINFITMIVIYADAVFESHGSTGRTLLQIIKRCPIDFENQNYTILTSKCKGPKYTADLCCPAFKEFACPFAKELNDLQTDCATTMFSYINLYGKYPAGLFANECKEGKNGLACSNNGTAAGAAPGPTSSSVPPASLRSPTLLLSSCILVFFACLL
ncbi:GPI-anchored protein llg1 [Dionaea muscipula]